MKWLRVFQIIFWVQATVNLIGALGPELSFDALWYHLPIARLIAERGWIGIIPGGLLYYSGMPRLMEFVNAGLLLFGTAAGMESSETLPKLLHFAAGLGSAGMIYKIARIYMSKTAGMMAVVLWYSTLVVGWQSIVVYIDLSRTFLVLVAIYWWIREKWIGSAIFMGAAYSVKLISGLDAVALAIAGGLIKHDWRLTLKYLTVFAPFPLLWGISNVNQGYGFLYPLFSHGILDEHWNWGWYQLLGPIMEALDPRARVGPAVLIILIWQWKNIWKDKEIKLLLAATAALLVAWYIFPRTGNGRYFLPSLAMLSIVSLTPFFRPNSREAGKPESPNWKKSVIVGLVVTQGLFGIAYRAAANVKFVPVVIGRETKDKFLTESLKFDYGDWYDTDGWVGEYLADERYKVIGVHNTYHLPGNKWEHESWTDPKECFPYVLVQGESLTDSSWEMVHIVSQTQTRIFKNNCRP